MLENVFTREQYNSDQETESSKRDPFLRKQNEHSTESLQPNPRSVQRVLGSEGGPVAPQAGRD